MMNRLLVILLASLLIGCATTPVDQNYDVPDESHEQDQDDHDGASSDDIPVSLTIYGDQDPVEALYPYRPSNMDSIGGSNFRSWEEKQDIAVFVHVPGDSLEDAEAMQLFGMGLSDLDKSVESDSVLFWENPNLPNPAFCIVAENDDVLISALETGQPIVEELHSFWHTNGISTQDSKPLVDSGSTISSGEIPWYHDSDLAALVIKDGLVAAKHRIDGREIELVHIVSDETDHQDEGLGYEVNIYGDPVPGLDIAGLTLMVKFHESRNQNFGGETGANLGFGGPWERHYPGNESSRFKIGYVSFITAEVRFHDGTMISTAKRGGDWNNPFTLPAYSFSGSNNWFSNPDVAMLYSDGTFIRARHRETGEEITLVRMDNRWIPSSPSSRSGHFQYRFVDLTDGLVLGGVVRDGVRFTTRPSGGNVFFAPFRFDGEPVVTVDVDYVPGSSPAANVTMVLDDANQDTFSDIREDGSLAFMDGNVLLIESEN